MGLLCVLRIVLPLAAFSQSAQLIQRKAKAGRCDAVARDPGPEEGDSGGTSKATLHSNDVASLYDFRAHAWHAALDPLQLK